MLCLESIPIKWEATTDENAIRDKKHQHRWNSERELADTENVSF